jgi:hypothetical protein
MNRFSACQRYATSTPRIAGTISLFHLFHQGIEHHKFFVKFFLVGSLEFMQVVHVKLLKMLNAISIVLNTVGNPFVWRINNSQDAVRAEMSGSHDSRDMDGFDIVKPFVMNGFVNYYGIVVYNHFQK